MVLALVFGFFLIAPLLLLITSIIHTTLGVSRGGESTPDVIANRPVTTPAPSAPPAPEIAVPVQPSVNGTLIEFPAREAQLARLRQQYATRA